MTALRQTLIFLTLGFMTTVNALSQTPPPDDRMELIPRSFSSLIGFETDNFLDAWKAFTRSCRLITGATNALRTGLPTPDDLRTLCKEALENQSLDNGEARRFFQTRFQPFEIIPKNSVRPTEPAFLTGYYEPIVPGSLQRSAEYSEPLLSRPDDLVGLDPKMTYPGLPAGLASARRKPNGELEPYPDRKAIDGGALADRVKPVVWVRDAIEAFMIHVQGSAAIKLDSGDMLRVTYAGRNGHPYTSIGKVLVDKREVPIEQMSLLRMKQWVRDNGQQLGEKGRALLHQNESFIFFSADTTGDRQEGPIGAVGAPLSALRSIAIDRTVWPYGLPFWLESDIPWTEPGGENLAFRRLMIAQDTGSAIVGPARADIYFGSGDAAGVLAGGIRHPGRMFVLLPRSAPDSGRP